MNKKYLLVVVGPTAIGKTSLAIKLARHYGTEIISADSRQFFKEMEIGTAVPTKQELIAAPHHFIQHKSIEDQYSVGDFEREALKILKEIFNKHDKVVMVGGSGLYVDAVVNGLDSFPDVTPQIRSALTEELDRTGIGSLQEQLKKWDPEYHSIVDLQNPHRLIRALEICIGTGKPYSAFRKNSGRKNRFFEPVYLGLGASREEVYARINRRVDMMMEAGLLEEAKKLHTKKHLNSLNTVGYKELFLYLEGKWDLQTAVSEIKKNTRRFAKRQFTWFKKNDNINWFDHNDPIENIIDLVNEKTASS